MASQVHEARAELAQALAQARAHHAAYVQLFNEQASRKASLLAVAHQELGPRAVGMTAVSPSLAPAERDEAAVVAQRIGADHRQVASSEIDDPSYVANNPDRCFHCKSELYRIAAAKQAEWGLSSIVNGTNTDDLGDYRPGLDAARAAGVVSPLVELGFTKDDVRAGAAAVGATFARVAVSASAGSFSRMPRNRSS